MTSMAEAATRAADTAEALWTGPLRSDAEPVPVLHHAPEADHIARREALRPLYEAIVERIGAPTLLGGTATGPSVRWCTRERILLLSGDTGRAVLTVRDANSFEDGEHSAFDHVDVGREGKPHRFDELPYTWQLDRKGPGTAPYVTYNGVIVVNDWGHAVTGIELMLASWVEQYPVQSPGDWIGFTLWINRDWRRDVIIGYQPDDHGRELFATIDDRGPEQTPERQERMRERGWQELNEHQWWSTHLPETDPRSPCRIAELVIAECRARRATRPAETTAHSASANDNGELWLTGLGLPTHPSRGEHF
ncbi:hypothetical protein [Streptomyces sp. WAC01526]|uniref:hypothetical protein n=1 Tax=Streptomyces sp. WAC01526 TaxID=2588709 RepID=UPI0011DFB40D|nr:hypothetical protein [Streptomyces sp. WAC01526]